MSFFLKFLEVGEGDGEELYCYGGRDVGHDAEGEDGDVAEGAA